jgi:hypothetical protein
VPSRRLEGGSDTFVLFSVFSDTHAPAISDYAACCVVSWIASA